MRREQEMNMPHKEETRKEHLPINHREIREKFLDFFEQRGHKTIRSSSLIPNNDPTLLIINSGMAPIKKYFTGEESPPASRLVDIQKCVRTNDIESVGDNRHLTFFEMMGNWSIGDYFKEYALQLAWELLVDEFKFDQSRLNVTTYGGDPDYPSIPPDEEAYKIWRSIGLSEKRIYRLRAEHNFWGPAGTTGPCGPCSEVFYDLGQNVGCRRKECGPDCDCGRFIEIWNPGVFMQYNKDAMGNFHELPFKSVDAGAGLERFAMILQGAKTVYGTDLLQPIQDSIISTNHISNQDNSGSELPLQIITDHLKSVVFMIGDGIHPSNTGREYVVRRLIRRMVAHARLLGIDHFKFTDTVDLIVSQFDPYYSELAVQSATIKQVLENETLNFSRTLSRAERELDKIVRRSGPSISGLDAFMLQDTYGLPFEILNSIAALRGLSIDKDGFMFEMERQRQRSRTKRE